jgi:hypothetical protein
VLTTQPDTAARPEARHARITSRLAGTRRQWAWLAVLVLAGLILFAAYYRQAWTSGVNSDGASNALQAWDMLHGNLLLRGWTVTDISFYTIQLPELAFAEQFRDLAPSVLHTTQALNYTLVVLGAALLARGRETGREGVVRALLAAGIMLAPTLGAGTTAMLHDPDHLGTQLPLLGVWLILDRARPRWQVAVMVAALLAWAQIADPMGLYEGVAPVVIVCAIRLYHRRDLIRRPRVLLDASWYELSLAAGAVISAGAAALTLRLIRQLGGFVLLQPGATFEPVRSLYQNVWTTAEDLLTLFGADFSGMRLGAHAVIPLVHLAGVALAGWALARALRRFPEHGLAVQVLAAACVVLLIAYVLRTQQDGGPHELVGVLVASAILAGRLLALPLIRGRHLTAAGLVLACYAGILAHDAAQRPAAHDPSQQLASWLQEHDLHDGLATYWSSDSVTFDSQYRVLVVPVYRYPDGRLKITDRADKATWLHRNASFLVLPSRGLGCAVGSARQWLATARAQFGPPSGSYRVGPFRVLTWHENLLRRIAEAAPGDPCLG